MRGNFIRGNDAASGRHAQSSRRVLACKCRQHKSQSCQVGVDKFDIWPFLGVSLSDQFKQTQMHETRQFEILFYWSSSRKKECSDNSFNHHATFLTFINAYQFSYGSLCRNLIVIQQIWKGTFPLRRPGQARTGFPLQSRLSFLRKVPSAYCVDKD